MTKNLSDCKEKVSLIAQEDAPPIADIGDKQYKLHGGV